MGEGIITRRGGGLITITFNNYNPGRPSPTALSVARDHLAGASVGDYALFAGGEIGTITYTPAVDAYTILATASFLITTGSKYKLNSDTEVVATANKIIELQTPINGYIKYKGGKFE